jgi:hypothetical protein
MRFHLHYLEWDVAGSGHDDRPHCSAPAGPSACERNNHITWARPLFSPFPRWQAGLIHLLDCFRAYVAEVAASKSMDFEAG